MQCSSSWVALDWNVYAGIFQLKNDYLTKEYDPETDDNSTPFYRGQRIHTKGNHDVFLDSALPWLLKPPQLRVYPISSQILPVILKSRGVVNTKRNGGMTRERSYQSRNRHTVTKACFSRDKAPDHTFIADPLQHIAFVSAPTKKQFDPDLIYNTLETNPIGKAIFRLISSDPTEPQPGLSGPKWARTDRIDV